MRRDVLMTVAELGAALATYYAMNPAEARALKMSLLLCGIRVARGVAERSGRLALVLEMEYQHVVTT